MAVVATEGGTAIATQTLIQIFVSGLRIPRLAVLLAVAVAAVAGGVPFFARSGPSALMTIDIGQALVIALIVMFGWIFDTPRPLQDPSSRSGQATAQFARCWHALWFIWLVLYLLWVTKDVLSVCGRPPLTNEWQLALNACGNFLNNSQSASLFFLFWILIRPSVRGGKMPDDVPVAATAALIIVLAVAEFILILTLPTAGVPGPLGISAADGASIVSSAVSGILAAATMGLFLGRTESAYLSTSISLLVAFYFYAAIQPLFPIFRLAELNGLLTESQLVPIQYSLKALALVFKLLLYFFVRTQLVSGRLTYMLDRMREHFQSVNGDWKEYEKTAFLA